MSTTLFAIAIAAAIGGDPGIPNGAYGAAEIPYNSNYSDSNYTDSNYPMTSSGVTGGIYGDPLYPFDSQYPWQHGYFQEISPYSGFHYFKPYNYRHVLSQTQTAAGWGITPQLAYSQHFWNRYQERATWKNYALPPREEDIEEIQQRKKDYQEQRSSSYQQQSTMVPVQYQRPHQQQNFNQQPQFSQPQQQRFQQQQQQQFQQQPAQNQFPPANRGYNQPPRY